MYFHCWGNKYMAHVPASNKVQDIFTVPSGIKQGDYLHLTANNVNYKYFHVNKVELQCTRSR